MASRTPTVIQIVIDLNLSPRLACMESFRTARRPKMLALISNKTPRQTRKKVFKGVCGATTKSATKQPITTETLTNAIFPARFIRADGHSEQANGCQMPHHTITLHSTSVRFGVRARGVSGAQFADARGLDRPHSN